MRWKTFWQEIYKLIIIFSEILQTREFNLVWRSIAVACIFSDVKTSAVLFRKRRCASVTPDAGIPHFLRVPLIQISYFPIILILQSIMIYQLLTFYSWWGTMESLGSELRVGKNKKIRHCGTWGKSVRIRHSELKPHLNGILRWGLIASSPVVAIASNPTNA